MHNELNEQPRKCGKIIVVGLGPGSESLLTPAAREALKSSDVIIGYRTYLNLIQPFLEGKEVAGSGMRQEVNRAKKAFELASEGKTVSVVCSGDSGIYGMAGLVYEVCSGTIQPEIEVIPGVPAFGAAAALLGAPLMHDFAAISLSDLLTPWKLITTRLELASEADFVLAIYNPRSHGRPDQIIEARSIVMRHRPPTTPVGIVREAYREGQSVTVTDLEHVLEHQIDMVTVLIVGNSRTYVKNGKMITPRGYAEKYDLECPREHS